MVDWLLIDVPSLAHRAFHTTGGLVFDGRHTGVVFGVLRYLVTLEGYFPGARPVFAFDSGPYLRAAVCPSYKAGWNGTDETLKRQLGQIRDDVLPALGYANIFHAPGYEADDVIASLTDALPAG